MSKLKMDTLEIASKENKQLFGEHGKRRTFLKKGAGAVVITTIPSRSVWGQGMGCTISGNLSGNLSNHTNVTCNTVSGKSSSFWRDHYVGVHFDKDHCDDDGRVKKKFKKHEGKFFVRTRWKKIYSDIRIDTPLGSTTYLGALESSDEFLIQIATAFINASIPELEYIYSKVSLSGLYISVMSGEVDETRVIDLLKDIHQDV